MRLHLLAANLSLFDGGAAAPAGAEGGEAAQAETQALPGSSRRAKKAGAYDNVVFGKQEAEASDAEPGADAPDAAGNGPDAGDNKADVVTTSNTLEERRAEFERLISEDYKDLFAERTQKIINRRFKDEKAKDEQLGAMSPIIDALKQKYRIDGDDLSALSQAIDNDDTYWEEIAEENGMTVEQYKRYQKVLKQNEELMRAERQRIGEEKAQSQLQNWYSQAEQVKQTYPEFELNAEVQNPQFLSLLKSGIPLQHAYEVVHMDDIKQRVATTIAQKTEKAVVDGIRSKGARPSENGTSSGGGGIIIKSDVSNLSKADRAEAVRRALRGDRISF